MVVKPPQKPDNSAQIAALNSQIYGYRNRIEALRFDIFELRKRLDRLQVAKSQNIQKMTVFETSMTMEKERIQRMRDDSVLRVAESYHERMRMALIISRSESINNMLVNKNMLFDREICRAEEEIHVKTLEIEQLECEISNLQWRIAGLG